MSGHNAKGISRPKTTAVEQFKSAPGGIGDGVGGSLDATKPHVPEDVRTEFNRPQTGNGSSSRGDRRDMSKTYSGNTKHAARGNMPRVDVKTRKR
ncbi:MAG TPA: hypothetical protein VG326_00255 [Tepidisphaeraceae bacterium]|jgi:hypothetical protein|nr:hypothetical protein [Tepidisphaeraceae bacterium]